MLFRSEGMSKPGKFDISRENKKATEEFEIKKISNSSSNWCNARFDEVKHNLLKTDYDQSKLHFIKGKVEDTIPNNIPNSISILRLDTDWYESTKHELIHLFPKLSKGGVLILDDYGFWQGAKKAVDEYFTLHNFPIFLMKVDADCRMAIKV